MKIEVLGSREEVASAGEEWDALLARASRGNPFLTHAWLGSWLAVYGEGCEPHVVCCRDEGGRLVGLLPACFERGGGPAGARRLRFMSGALVGSTRLDCIADPACEGEVHAAVAAHVAEARGEWDVLDLDLADGRSAFPEVLASTLASHRLAARIERWTDCPSMPLPPTFDEYLARLSKRRRTFLRRERKDLEAIGTVTLETVTEPEALAGALRDTTTMFEQSMRRKFGRPYEASDRYRAFMRSVSDRFLEAGTLRLVFLTVDGERVAFVYQVAHGPTLHAHQTGFREEWADHRVGMAVFGYAIEAAIGQGFACYDLGPGEGEHKTRLGAEDRAEIASVRAYSPSLAGRVASVRDRTSELAKDAVKRGAPERVATRLRREVNWRDLQRL